MKDTLVRNTGGSYNIIPDTRLNWQAIDNAQHWFRTVYKEELAREREQYGEGCMSDTWCDWIRDNAGLEHTTTSIKIVDEQKYMLFILRFS